MHSPWNTLHPDHLNQFDLLKGCDSWKSKSADSKAIEMHFKYAIFSEWDGCAWHRPGLM